MSSTIKRWENFWSARMMPGHRFESEEHYASYARELQLLFGQQDHRRVLELGCGNGALFRWLRFDTCREYVGVDFSHSMAGAFKAQFPGVNVIVAEASSYCDNRVYDLIFSCELVQFFDGEMLRRHFRNARTMMGPDSLFICASVLCRELRTAYTSGDFSLAPLSRVRALGAQIKRRFRDDNGYWYRYREIRNLGTECDLSAQIWGAMHYPYRFHAVMRRR